MEALIEGRGEEEGRRQEQGTVGWGCWDGGKGILFNFILSPCLHQPCRAQLFNIYTQEEERMRKNRE